MLIARRITAFFIDLGIAFVVNNFILNIVFAAYYYIFNSSALSVLFSPRITIFWVFLWFFLRDYLSRGIFSIGLKATNLHIVVLIKDGRKIIRILSIFLRNVIWVFLILLPIEFLKYYSNFRIDLYLLFISLGAVIFFLPLTVILSNDSIGLHEYLSFSRVELINEIQSENIPGWKSSLLYKRTLRSRIDIKDACKAFSSSAFITFILVSYFILSHGSIREEIKKYADFIDGNYADSGDFEISPYIDAIPPVDYLLENLGFTNISGFGSSGLLPIHVSDKIWNETNDLIGPWEMSLSYVNEADKIELTSTTKDKYQLPMGFSYLDLYIEPKYAAYNLPRTELVMQHIVDGIFSRNMNLHFIQIHSRRIILHGILEISISNDYWAYSNDFHKAEFFFEEGHHGEFLLGTRLF